MLSIEYLELKAPLSSKATGCWPHVLLPRTATTPQAIKQVQGQPHTDEPIQISRSTAPTLCPSRVTFQFKVPFIRSG